MDKTIIGLTGSFGSGCTHIAKKHLIPRGFTCLSLSEYLKKSYRKAHGHDAKIRTELQDYGNEIRSKNNNYDLLAQEAINDIESGINNERWVIDSIKNPFEVKAFRDKYSNFFLLGVFAEYDVRWNRKKGIYEENQGNFRKDDERDSSEDIIYGQRVRDCFNTSDIIILNNKNYNEGSNKHKNMEGKIEDFLCLIGKSSSRSPSEEEALMAIAYANSLRSSCLKRKVGAIIVDKYGFILSSGYNEVSIGQNPCKGEHGGCYRDLIKDSFHDIIDKHVKDEESNKLVKNEIFKKYKMLDYCRALHAEENAIINMARIGNTINLKEATLYTTTYPCNLCANKIAQIGIGKIIYFEPYPQEEAKMLLNSKNIKQDSFEGVTFNGYFKLFQGIF